MRIPAPILWTLAALTTFVAQVVKSGDWQHLMWVTMLPLLALVATGGLMLAAGKGRSAALLIAVIGLMPLVLLGAKGGLDDHEVTAVKSVPAAVLEVVEFGFTGETPACMAPVPGAPDLDSGKTLRSPSRDVTVPMGALYFASIALILLGVIVLISRAIPRGLTRSVWLSVSPLSVLVLVQFAGGIRSAELHVWRNEPWLVQAIGPLAAAAGAALVLIFVLADTSKSTEPES